MAPYAPMAPVGIAMSSLARLGCCTPDNIDAMRMTLVGVIRAELPAAISIGVVVIGHDDPEGLEYLRVRAPGSPVWQHMDDRPDAVVVVAWAEVADA